MYTLSAPASTAGQVHCAINLSAHHRVKMVAHVRLQMYVLVSQVLLVSSKSLELSKIRSNLGPSCSRDVTSAANECVLSPYFIRTFDQKYLMDQFSGKFVAYTTQNLRAEYDQSVNEVRVFFLS